MNFNTIKFSKHDNVGIIQINRPDAKNALNDEVRWELLEALDLLQAEQSLKVGILTGGEKIFAAGADIKDMVNAQPFEIMSARGTRVVTERIEQLTKPVIAAISGYALGGGCELALACDYRIASDTSLIGLPEINLGIIPGGGGTQRLARLIGASKAKDLIFSGRLLNGEDAFNIGLIDLIVQSGESVIEAAIQRGSEYAKHSAAALSMAKLSLNKGANMDIVSALSFEQLCFSMLFSTEDQKIKMKNFIEKRRKK